MVLRRATSLRGLLEGGFWAQIAPASLVPFQGKKVLIFRAHPFQVMMLQPSKPLSISTIKTTGTLVVLCTQLLLCGVVVCCCVLLCVRGVGRSPCSCIVCLVRRCLGGRGWLAGLPLLSHYTVGIHWWMLVGGGQLTSTHYSQYKLSRYLFR